MTETELVFLSYRYAAMIGVIDADEMYANAAQVAADRAAWPELIEVREGVPVFDFDNCAGWMAALSGECFRRCRAVVFAIWGDAADQQYADELPTRH